MDNLNVNPTLAEGDLLELSPLKMPNSILKPSQKDNLIMLQTPVHKQLKVSFITPKRTPAPGQKLHPNLDAMGTTPQINTPMDGSFNSVSENVPIVPQKMGPPTCITDTPKHNSGMPAMKKGIIPRRPGTSSQEMGPAAKKDETKVGSGEEKGPQKDKNDSKWEDLRKLDENLRWRERVEVITKLDHQEYNECAREYIGEMIDKAVDISLNKSKQVQGSNVMTTMTQAATPLANSITPLTTSAASKITTPMSQVMTPVSKVNDSNSAIISPIARSVTQKPNVMTPGAEVMTPNICGINTTFDMSAHGSFIAEKNENDIGAPTSDKKETATKSKVSGMRQPSSLKKPASVRPKARPISKSQSTLDTSTNNQNSPKNAFNLGSRAYSFDLDNIPEDFDPFSPKNTLRTGSAVSTRHCSQTVEDSKANSSVDAGNTSANASVFEPTVQTSNYALREVDLTFGDSNFIDGSKLLEQGQLDLDFLEQKTPGGVSADLRKQSLYMKFDPLLEGLGNRQSLVLLGRKSDIIDFTGRVTPVPEDVAEEPAVISPREPDLLCDSPSQIGGGSVTFENSNIARGSASDSIGSASPNLQHSAAFKPDSGIIEMLKYSEADIQRILSRKKEKWTQERNESEKLCAELTNQKQVAEILSKDSEVRLEQKLKESEEVKKNNAEEIKILKEEKKKIDSKIKSLTRSSSVIFQQTETLQKMSSNLQANELKQKEHMTDFRAKCTASQKKSIELEHETAETLKKIEEEKATAEANFAAQLNSLQMKIRAAELRVKSLQTSLDHKKNENKELMKICDELVAVQ